MSHQSATDSIIGHRLFVDGARRPVYQDERGQYVRGYDGEKVYGVSLLSEEEACDEPVVVENEAEAGDHDQGGKGNGLTCIRRVL